MTVTLEQARIMIAETFKKGHELGLKPLSAVVLDAGGHVQAFEREDGAAPGRFGIAHGKAYGAVLLGMAGRAQMAVVPVPGGLLLRDAAGVVIGALGVTGDTSDNDVLAALAGIAAAGLIGEE